MAGRQGNTPTLSRTGSALDQESGEHSTDQNNKGVFRRFIESTFAFNRMAFTIVFVVFYLASMAWIAHVEDRKIPDLNTEYPIEHSQRAYTDLQMISKSFHPYNSHANDEVHDYILDQVTKIADSSSSYKVEVVDDVRKTFFGQRPVFSPGDTFENAFYYDSNNILVKIPGKNESLKSVLLSAHYDSVATGKGTIDDGTGTVSVIAALRYIVENDIQPLRSIVFLLNNNEEVGLLGAEALFFHPWSEDIEYFVNLEGAGADGRAVLFRATDYGSVRHFSNAARPHGNSVLQQGFQSGLVSSQTDYKVFAERGLRGVDIAFYKGRSKYHTRRDNIHASSIEAISHMFGTALTTALSMADEKDPAPFDNENAVYFDVNGWFFHYPLSTLFRWNITALIAGPLLVLLMWRLVVDTHAWDVTPRGWGRGVLSFAVSTSITVAVAIWINRVNPYLINSYLYSSLITLGAVFLLSNYTILGLANYLKPVHDQKLIIFIEILILLWALLVYSTVQVARGATGFYLPTVLYNVYLTAVLLGMLGLLAGRPKADIETPEESEALLGDNRESYYGTTNAEATTAEDTRVQRRLVRLKNAAKRSLSYDWSIQFLVVVPVGLWCTFDLCCVVLDSLHDSPPAANEVFPFMSVVTSAVAITLGLLVMPFVHRTHSLLVVVLVAIIGVFGARSLSAFPFTYEWPMSTRFVQRVNLDDEVPIARTYISNPVGGGYLQSALETLPSLKSAATKPDCHEATNGATSCVLIGPQPWAVPSANFSDWLSVETVDNVASSRGLNKGQIVINAPDNRFCYIQFNTTNFATVDRNGASPVRKITVHHTNDSAVNEIETDGWRSTPEFDEGTFPHGANEFNFYTLDWERSSYRIEFDWLPSWYEGDGGENNKLGVTVTCTWSEYDQSVVDRDGELHRKIPALDEILEYTPEWVSWSKATTGLVEVKKYVEL